MLQITLESIANKLLAGTIDSKEANGLIKTLKINPCPKKNSFFEKEIIVQEDNYLSLQDRKGKEKAYIEFRLGTDCFENKFVWLIHTESFCEGEGNFKKLFLKLESIGKKSKAQYIKLEVDYCKDRVISIYNHLGFSQLAPIETISENIDRIEMRKELISQ